MLDLKILDEISVSLIVVPLQDGMYGSLLTSSNDCQEMHD
jgi:hypothetical protein